MIDEPAQYLTPVQSADKRGSPSVGKSALQLGPLIVSGIANVGWSGGGPYQDDFVDSPFAPFLLPFGMLAAGLTLVFSRARLCRHVAAAYVVTAAFVPGRGLLGSSAQLLRTVQGLSHISTLLTIALVIGLSALVLLARLMCDQRLPRGGWQRIGWPLGILAASVWAAGWVLTGRPSAWVTSGSPTKLAAEVVSAPLRALAGAVLITSASMIAAVLLAWLYDVPLRVRPLNPAGSCRFCGYSLKGNVSGHCPECGQSCGSPIDC